jgi:hypothetical protein
MGLRFDTSLFRAAWALTRQWSLQIEAWETLAARDEFRNASLAIVGNAGYLAELRQGPKIETHDLILRMNNFQVAGFESRVGARTDIFLTTFHTDVKLQNPAMRQAKFIVTSVPNNLRRQRSCGVLSAHAVQIATGMQQLKRRQAFVPDWNYFLAKKELTGKYPTSGAMAIFLATEFLAQRCRSIYLTGFSFFRGQSHYFNEQAVIPRNHDVEREETVIRQQLEPLVAIGKISLDERMAAQLDLR